MAKIQSQFPVGSFYLRGGNNGKGTINIRYLTPEQLKEFVDIYHNMKRQRTWEIMQMFLFSVNTGLRISDIVAL